MRKIKLFTFLLIFSSPVFADPKMELGLDVYNGEPDIHSGYLQFPNVFVLPHLGSSTMKTRTAMANLAIENMEEFFKTGKSKNKVN